MRCSSSRLLFDGLLDGALAGRTHVALEQHLEGCFDCRGLLEELRVVDALLLQATSADVPAGFTERTMNEIARLPMPRPAGPALLPFVVSYLIAAWLAIGLAFLFAGDATRAAMATALGVSGAELAAIGALAHGLFHSFDGSLNGLTAVSAGALLADVMAWVAFFALYRAYRARRSETARR